MTNDDREIVSALQLSLAERVGPQRFELWFGSHTRLRLGEGSLQVAVPNRFYQDWLRNNFRRDIEASCLAAVGKPLAVTFQIDPSLHAAPAAPSAPAPAPPAAAEAPAPAAATLQLAAADAASQGRPIARRRFATLGGFVVGSGSRLAHASALAVAQRPGTISPLVLHGPTGVGKTHLLEGIWSAARHAHPTLQAVYLSAEQFTTYFLAALQGSGLPNFRRKYRGVELLIIDDLQFFAGKRATIVELLHTVETLLRQGRQLVLAADRAPEELCELGPELIARLQGGLVCSLEPPDYETRLEIVSRMAHALALEVPEEVRAYVAAHVNTHARALAGALKRLALASQAHQQPISLSLAEDALAEVLRSRSRNVRLPDIEEAVCRVFGLESKTLQSARKGKLVDQPRMLAMWLARKHTRAALSEIGSYFGGRSHSTVIAAQRKVNTLVAAQAAIAAADRPCQIQDAIRRVEDALRAG